MSAVSHNCVSDIFSHNLPTDRARELFKPNEDMESLQVLLVKKWEVLGLNFFFNVKIILDDIISGCEKSSSGIYMFFLLN